MTEAYTRSVMVQTLCAPCHSHCRYCLLSWSGRANGADYERSEAYARRFHEWLSENKPNVNFNFSFGYSMEHPKLLRAVDFMREIGSAGGSFLQMDGMAFRTEAELRELASALRAHGMETLNFTFYGSREYHDRFAARQGDYELMMSMMRIASEAGLFVSAGIPLTQENAGEIESVFDALKKGGAGGVRLFIPHGEGRGRCLESCRFSLSDFEKLSDRMRCEVSRLVFRTEGEWLAMPKTPWNMNRALLISLTPENIEHYESAPFEQVIAETEKLDEDYYAAIPPFQKLAELYGDRQGERLYGYRDLFHLYQHRYIEDHALDIYDVTDETQTGSRRY